MVRRPSRVPKLAPSRGASASRYSMEATTQLFLGVHRGSGSGWHCASGDNLFFMVHGRKKWSFVHPDHRFFCPYLGDADRLPGGQWATVKRTGFVTGLLDNGALLVKDTTTSDDAPESPTVDTTTTDAPPTTISKRRRKASPSAKE